MKSLFLIALGVAAACAQTSTSSAQVPASQARASLRPIADYHAHISSVALDEHMVPPTLPIIQLSNDLAALIKEREAFGDRDVSGIYTTDAVVWDAARRAWVRGRSGARGFLSASRPGLRYLPVEARVDANGGFIAGYTAVGAGDKPILARHVLFVIRREEGQWRIASEISADAPRTPLAYPAVDYVAELDSAGVQWGVVLSAAFVFASGASPTRETEQKDVMRENDWVAEQVALFPDRLIGFCGLNPLRDYAPEEVRRCSRIKGIRGIKMHLHDAEFDFRNADHIRRVRSVFQAANDVGLHITVHISSDLSRRDIASSRQNATVFLNEFLAASPKIIVQVAHMTGDGGWDPVIDASFEVLANAITSKDPRTRNLYFDGSGATGMTPDMVPLLTRRMREVGLNRILFASDRHKRNPPAREAWISWRALPLTDAELRTIASNRLPYLPPGR